MGRRNNRLGFDTDPMANDHIPYDQTDPQDPTAGPSAGAPDPTMGDPASAGTDPGIINAAMQGDQQVPMLSQVDGQDPAAGGATPGNTDQMSDADLAAQLGVNDPSMTEGLDPQSMQLQQLEQALTSPDASPNDRAQVEQLMAMAAKRRMLGGQGA